MKTLLVSLYFVFASSGEYISTEKLRKSFHASILDESKVETFYELVNRLEPRTSLETAYVAAGHAMMAKVSANPYSKYSLVKKYMTMMDEAVSADGENAEIRFLRLAIDKNIPWIFGRNSNQVEDKEVVMKLVATNNVPDFDPDFQKYILYFLKHEGICNQDEISLIAQKFQG